MIPLIIITITILYLVLIGSLVYGFNKIENFIPGDLEPKTTFSIIIPFRNEAENLPELLTTLEGLNYPKSLFEILLIDDASEDNSVSIINETNSSKSLNLKIIKNIRRTNSPKKDAITNAIKIAKHEWIVTTDADCIVPKYWLDTFDCFIQKENCNFIASPVTYQETNSFLKRFQLLDFLSLIGATIGGFGISKPFLCNGANLAYKKDYFNTLNGFEGNTNIASGDDIFLLQKALKNDGSSVRFIKSIQTIVKTKPQYSWGDLVAQRKRWAAKTSSYNSLFGKLTGLLVLLMNAALICALTLTIMRLFNLKLLVYIFIIKSSIDFLLLFKTSRFLNQEKNLSSFLFSSLLYPFFSVYIAFISMFTSYKWKGRRFSK